jgi:predicted GTPase
MASPLRQWRSWVLVLLLVGPVLAYVGLGMLWLWEHGWVACTIAAVIWLAAGGLFSLLAARWTTTARPLLPPLDWDSPNTFAPLDRDAWKLVQDEAQQGETLSFDVLLGADVYIETGRRLLRRLADHYHPFSTDPLDDVPVAELLTAFELAAEDLGGMARQIPGGDLIALSHWRRAVQVADYINKANDLYSFVLPLLNPVTGLTRLGTREWIVKPAWKSMQQNVLRWFYEAYVNRLGIHLIELLSGRLAIGATQYRRLTRRPHAPLPASPELELKPLTIIVAGAKGSGKSRLIAMIQQACSGEMSLIKSRAAGLGLDATLFDRVKDAHWIESHSYQHRADRSSRKAAISSAAECDLLLLVIDGSRHEVSADIAFAREWDRWFQEHPYHEVPPALVVITGVDRPEFGGDWTSHVEGPLAPARLEPLIRARFDNLRASLPPTFHAFAAVGLGEDTPFGVVEHLVPALTPLLLTAERTALIRRLREVSGRSKVSRLMHQLGAHGRSLWGSLKARHHAGAPPR